MLRTEASLGSTGMTTAGPSEGSPDASGGAFDFEDLQAMREEYEERLRRLEREKDAALDVVRKDAGQRMAALRAEQEARLAAESEMRQQLIEELTIELASAREEGEHVARSAERRRAAAEQQLRWALGELDRLGGELARVRDVLVAYLTPQPAPVVEAPPIPAEGLVMSAAPATPASGVQALRRKRIRLR